MATTVITRNARGGRSIRSVSKSSGRKVVAIIKGGSSEQRQAEAEKISKQIKKSGRSGSTTAQRIKLSKPQEVRTMEQKTPTSSQAVVNPQVSPSTQSSAKNILLGNQANLLLQSVRPNQSYARTRTQNNLIGNQTGMTLDSVRPTYTSAKVPARNYTSAPRNSRRIENTKVIAKNAAKSFFTLKGPEKNLQDNRPYRIASTVPIEASLRAVRNFKQASPSDKGRFIGQSAGVASFATGVGATKAGIGFAISKLPRAGQVAVKTSIFFGRTEQQGNIITNTGKAISKTTVSKEDKALRQRSSFDTAIRNAFEYEDSRNNLGGNFITSINKGLASKESKTNFKLQLLKEFKSQGFKDQELERLTALGMRERKFIVSEQLVSFTNVNRRSEKLGRTLFSDQFAKNGLSGKTVDTRKFSTVLGRSATVNIGAAGVVEGASIVSAEQRASRRRFDGKEVITGGLVGGAVAAPLGRFIVKKGISPSKSARFKGKVVETFVNVADPYEKAGDFAEDVTEKVGFKFFKRQRPNTQVSIPNSVITFGGSPKKGRSKARNVNPVTPNFDSGLLAVSSNFGSNPPTKTNPIVPIKTNPLTSAFTSTKTQIQTGIKTKTKTTVGVPVVTGTKPIFGIIPAGEFAFSRKGKRGPTKTKKKFTPNLSAVGLNIRGKNKRTTGLTGLEIRKIQV